MSDVNKKLFIILSYVCFLGIQLFYSTITRGLGRSADYLLILAVYGLLAFLAYRGNRASTWIMIVSVLLSGVGAFGVGVLFVSVDQLAMKVIFILLGVYFLYGGVKLMSIARKEKD